MIWRAIAIVIVALLAIGVVVAMPCVALAEALRAIRAA